MSAEDRAAKAAEDLKKRVELGIDDSRPECDRETEVSFGCIFDYFDYKKSEQKILFLRVY